MSDERINKLAETLEAVQHDPEHLRAALKKAKISDLLVLHFLNMGYSGCSPHELIPAIEEELIGHFMDGGSYLNR